MYLSERREEERVCNQQNHCHVDIRTSFVQVAPSNSLDEKECSIEDEQTRCLPGISHQYRKGNAHKHSRKAKVDFPKQRSACNQENIR